MASFQSFPSSESTASFTVLGSSSVIDKAKGYCQVPGIDFGNIFSPVAKVTSIRLLLSVVVAFDFEVE